MGINNIIILGHVAKLDCNTLSFGCCCTNIHHIASHVGQEFWSSSPNHSKLNLRNIIKTVTEKKNIFLKKVGNQTDLIILFKTELVCTTLFTD